MKQHSPAVLYYHSVAPHAFDNWVLRFLTMQLDKFEAQMQYLQQHGYRSVFPDEWLACRRGEKNCDGRSVVLTFDDGLLDNWVYAYPMAKKYGMRITLFVCPEYVDPRDLRRPNLDDVWAGRCRAEELQGLGYISWRELREMQTSGIVDVQSHTMSHAKYIVSSKLTGFYHGGFPGMHSILNADPSIKPFYTEDPHFEQRLALGTPLFEETSASVARIHTIHPDFYAEVAALAAGYDLTQAGQRPDFEAHARAVYERWEKSGRLIAAVETESEYLTRLEYEIVRSKQILEEQLGKPVQFLCWPHGDNSHQAHALALNAGYRATTAGKLVQEGGKTDRMPRIGTDWGHGPWLNRRKMDYKLNSHYKKQPYYTFWLVNEYKNRLLKRG